MSSILSVSSRIVEHAPQTLHLVAFGTGDRAHWALFAPNRTTDHRKTLLQKWLEGTRRGEWMGGLRVGRLEVKTLSFHTNLEQKHLSLHITTPLMYSEWSQLDVKPESAELLPENLSFCTSPGEDMGANG
ncbi:predicted protein [Histoplasma capsulatum H143]|uniref:Uncharacterized protein n=1 Tax=Ajellomyces capsulatus (strain H143) TaxID=544712 RepID=C6HHF3_AJECH|nr:predicted protein [Histoplasma capsulatum H143]